MAAKCPNKSHKDYKLLVRLFGEDNALFYYDRLGTVPTTDVIAELYKQDKGVELTDTNNPQVWDIEDSEDLIGRWRTDKQGKRVPVKRAFNPYRASALAKQLREKYPEAKVTTYKFLTENKSNNKISISVPLKTEPTPKMMGKTQYEQRALEGIPQRDLLTPNERKDFERKKEIMLKTFPWVKGIIEDVNLVNLGQVEQNGSIIRVNPLKMSKDTIGHEFGHLLIDVIGGLENPLVKAGLKQLEDTPLAKRIRDAYADKTDTVIQKEILAEALGMDVAKLFEEEQDRTKWQNWLVRLFEKIKRKLGIEKGAVRRLSRMVLGSEEFNVVAPVAEEIYEQKDVPKEEVETFAESTVAQLHTKIVDVLKTKVQIYERTDAEADAKALEHKLSGLEEEGSNIKALFIFAGYAASQTDVIYKTYAKARAKVDAGDKGAISAKDLLRWSDYVSAFDIIDEIETALVKRYGLNRYETSPYLAKVKKYIQDAKTKRDLINSFLKDEGTDIVADWLEPYTTRVVAEQKLLHEKAWRKLDKSTRPPKDEYIADKLALEESDIQKNTRVRIRAELKKGAFDIGLAYRFAENVLDSDDVVIASMAKAFALQLDRAREATLDRRDDLVDKLKQLEKAQTGFKNNEEFYEFMIEKDSKGKFTNKIVDKFKGEFWEAFDAYKEKVQTTHDDAVEAINTNTEYTEDYKSYLISRQKNALQEAITTWKGENAPIQQIEMMDAKEAYIRSLKEEGTLTEDEMETAIQVVRSPKFVEMASVLNNERGLHLIDKWGRENVWEYRKPLPKWESTKFKAIQALRISNPNDPRIQYFDLIKEMIKEGEKSLPYRYRLRQSMPFMAKSTLERMQSGLTAKSTIRAKGKETFLASAFDVEKGQLDERTNTALELTDENNNPKLFLPVYYTPKIVALYKTIDGKEVKKTDKEIAQEKQEALENQSFDLSSIYYNWYKMAMDYKYKSEVLPQMELTKYLIEQREVTKLDSKANPIMNANEKLKQRHLTKSGMQSLLAAQLNDWFESVVYGKTSKEEGDISVLGVKFDKAKTADLLNKYTAYNLLGLNLMQGVANKALGEVMQVAEMFAGQHYNIKDYTKATGQYNQNLPGIMGDIGQRKPTNIVSLLLEKFDILHDYSDRENFRKRTVFGQLMTTNTLFFMAKAGEHSMQAKAMLAVLNNMNAKDKNGKVLTDKNGKEMSMFDAFGVNKKGKLVLDERLDMTTQEVDLIGHTLKRLLSRMHGEYSDIGKVALQRYALGRMAYMFRKFIIQGYKRRWERSSRKDAEGRRLLKYNELGGFFTEGSYISTFNFAKQLVVDLKTFKFDVGKAYAHASGELSETEISNIRRTLAEVVAFGLMWSMSTMLLNVKGETDDDKLLISHLAYQTLRLKSELKFFISPFEAMKILRSPAAAMSAIENISRLIAQLGHPFEEFQRGPWKDHYKMTKHFVNLIQVGRQYPRILDVENQLNWFK